MNYQSILDRILHAVDADAYVVGTERLDPVQKAASEEVIAELSRPGLDAPALRGRIRRMREEGRIDTLVMLSLLHIVEASPQVRDYVEAARLAGEQELEALRLGGPELDAHLASVERHRGVLAFLLGSYEVALDHFGRALERERSVMNLQNILATMIRLGEEADARELLQQISTSYPPRLVSGLRTAIERDPDLSLLRSP